MADAPWKTPLHAWHTSHGGRLVAFAGWSMPLQYTSIVEEHVATRTAVGLFDISHMGRLEITGSGGVALLERLLTRRVAPIKPGGIRYSLITNERGGILDDVLVYHLHGPGSTARLLLVVNASNRNKIVSWIEAHRRDDEDAALIDWTRDTAMLAVQGPHAVSLVNPLLAADLSGMKYYTGTVSRFGDWEVVVSRTGYTGEDGCELWVPRDAAVDVWQRLLDNGRSCGAVPAGLGARDTLRLEAGMPLYGHELSEQTHPFQAGLGFAVHLEQHEFIGRDALAVAQHDTTCRVRVGLRVDGRRVPREHCRVLQGGSVVGEVTSGTFSPTLQRSIAMAYVAPAVRQPGTQLDVDVRGRSIAAEVVDLPFYSRYS